MNALNKTYPHQKRPRDRPSQRHRPQRPLLSPTAKCWRSAPRRPASADETIDAIGLIVAPAFVDLSARLREPGFEYKATLESEMQAAMQGGVTSLVCPPDTDPVLDEPGRVEMLSTARKTEPGARAPLGALTVA
jgi:dihydroorotase-like cyclic amidohydrolase